MDPISKSEMNQMLRALGSAVRGLREEKGLTQEDLASRVKLHDSYICLVERGRRNPTWETVRKIAKALDTPLSQLARRVEGSERKP